MMPLREKKKMPAMKKRSRVTPCTRTSKHGKDMMMKGYSRAGGR